MKGKQFIVVYDTDHLPEVPGYVEEHPGAQVICLDFWIERELEKQHISYISLRELAIPEDTEEEWWLLAQEVAREWYRLPAMQFFKYDDIRIAEALEPIMELYLSQLFYYVRIYAAIKKAHPEASFYIPVPVVDDEPTAGCLISFERWAVIDAARVACILNSVPGERVAAPQGHLFPRTVWKSLLVRVYNALIGILPHRKLRIYASEYWSHIAPIIERMDDTELVLMESNEFGKIPWRQILQRRIRIRHPADATTSSMKRKAVWRSQEFMKQWATAREEVAAYFSRTQEILNWSPVLEACEYLITYSPRVITDIDALQRIMKEEKPDVVLQRASIGGRLYHFFLLARIAAQHNIPSIELQHSGAIFDRRSVHSHLETSVLAAYGDVEREQYARNGYAPERIIAVGSPRFDQYRQHKEQVGHSRAETLHAIGLDPARPTVMAAVPAELILLSPFAFSSYDMAKFFQGIQNIQRTMPAVQLIFKFRRTCNEHYRDYLHELFPEGGIAITDEDPHPFIQASDVVVSGNSTIMYETMITERLLVLYPWKKWDYHLGLYSAVAPYAHSGTELASILKNIYSDKTYADNIAAKEQFFMQRHSFDGHSAERTIALLRRSISA
jgi:hypothetical protein